MLKLLLIIFYSFNIHAAVSTGTGVTGACNQLTIQNADAGPYNCTTFITAADINITGTDNLVIYVQGAVSINHIITISGETGTNGVDDDMTDATGGTAGSGGGNGGTGNAFGGTFENGFGDIGGAYGGTPYFDGSDTSAKAAGGGGGGGSFDGQGDPGGAGNSVGLAHIDSYTGAGGSEGDGSISPSTLLGLIPNLPGGSGGGSGGHGSSYIGDLGTGGGGGAGGGSITIIAGGDITIGVAGMIDASGEAGGVGWSSGGDTGPGGSGGAGSGGLIFLYSKKQISHNGTLLATGGSQTTGKIEGSAQGGFGGAGGKGIIRLDDFGGEISGSGSSNPAAYIYSSKPLFDSDEIGFYCASTEVPPAPPWNQLITLFFAVIGTIGSMKIFAKLKWSRF